MSAPEQTDSHIDEFFPDEIMGGQTVLVVLKKNPTAFRGVITQYSSIKGMVTLREGTKTHRIALAEVAAVSAQEDGDA